MVKAPDEIWRDFVTDGVPSSGRWNPSKPDIREYETYVYETLESVGTAVNSAIRSDILMALDDDAKVRALSNLGLEGYSYERQRAWHSVIGKVINGIGQKWVTLGDSANAGLGGSSFEGTAWGASRYTTPSFGMSKILQASGIESRADGFIGSAGHASTTAYSQYNGLCVGFAGSGWSVALGDYAGGAYFQVTGFFGTDNAMVFTPLKATDRFDIYYISNAGTGNFTVTDASGTIGTFSTAGAAGVKKVTITRSTASLAPIRVFLTANGTGYIEGIDPWNSNLAELRVLNLAVSGWRADNALAASTSGTGFSARQALAVIDPDATYIEFGKNDKSNGVPLATYIDNINSLTNDALSTGAAILGIGDPSQNGHPSNLTPDWRLSLFNLAATKGVPCVDIYSRFISYEANPSDYYDVLHPNRSGYGIKAQTLAKWALT